MLSYSSSLPQQHHRKVTLPPHRIQFHQQGSPSTPPKPTGPPGRPYPGHPHPQEERYPNYINIHNHPHHHPAPLGAGPVVPSPLPPSCLLRHPNYLNNHHYCAPLWVTPALLSISITPSALITHSAPFRPPCSCPFQVGGTNCLVVC